MSAIIFLERTFDKTPRQTSKTFMVAVQKDFSRYDRKLEFILRTAARIFAEKGYHSTSMRDISRETGVSLAGLMIVTPRAARSRANIVAAFCP